MKLKKQNRSIVVFFLTLGLLSYTAFPFLPSNQLISNVSAYGLSSIPEKEGLVYAVTASGKLINFNFFTPSAINNSVNITNLQTGELVVGVDFRPRTGQLVGVTNQSRVYTIDTATGAATPVGTVPFTPGVTGGAFGVDFNPVPDLIRVVTNQDDQNLRVNPNTGAVAGTDTNLAFAATDMNAGADPNVVGVAYTNSFSGATSTTLYGIDSDLNILVRQGSEGGAQVSPNSGQLFTIGQLGVDTDEQVGLDIFDIVPPRPSDQVAPGDAGLASLTSPGATSSSLYWIELRTGAATLISQIGGGEPIRDITIVPRVETIFALTQSNRLVYFNSGMPGNPIRTLTITGVSDGESLVALDFRPATGELYSISSSGRIYSVNTSTGLARAVSSSFVSAAGNNPQIGFDFNPAPDLIRLVSGNDQNLRINPNNSAVAGVDGNLAYDAGDGNVGANPNIVASAYLNNVAGPTPPSPGDPATVLYGIDSNLDILVTQGSAFGAPAPPVSPNTGRLFTIGKLTAGVGGPPLDVTDDGGFDIAPETGAAFASLTLQATPSSPTLYTINLASGAATPIGTIAAGDVVRDIAIGVRIEKVFAMAPNNTLVSFNSRTPGTILSTVGIRGLQSGETLVGIDFRPATGQLYGIGTSRRLYLIDTIEGRAMPVTNSSSLLPLSGNSIGFDFNPVPDRIRFISDGGLNLRLNPNDGTVAGTDTPLFFGPGDNFADRKPTAAAAAYTNNFAGTMSTTLYVIDSALNILARQGSPGGMPISPNMGQLSTVGPLGVVTTNQVGFDITDTGGGTAYASLTAPGTSQSQLYSINLRTGAASPVAANNAIGVSGVITDIAVQTIYTPSAVEGGFVITNSASFNVGVVAPDSLASLFGPFQTQGGQVFIAASVPTGQPALGGISVTFNGDNGAFPASVSYVTPGQINVVVPSGISDGPALVQVTNTNGGTRTGIVQIARAAPGIYSLNGTGSGTAYAYTTFDGVTYDSVLNPDGSEKPISIADASGRPNIIAILATGLRNATADNPNDINGVAEAVTATVQGVSVPVLYSDATGIDGIDQTNIMIPSSFAQLIPATGRLPITLQFSANGQTSNIVSLTIAPPIGGAPPSAAPQSVGLGQTINGSLTATDELQALPGDTSRSAYLYDAYRFTGSADTRIAIDLRSPNFDAAATLYQVVVDGNGKESLLPIASDDNSGGQLGVDGAPLNSDSLLTTILPANGEYVVNVSSSRIAPAATGEYMLRITSNPLQSIAYGLNIRGSIVTDDLKTSADIPYDLYQFQGAAGDQVQIRMSAELVDSFLELKLRDGTRFAFDNSSGGGLKNLDAMITATLPYTGSYFVFASPAGSPLQSGNYTLTLTRIGRGGSVTVNVATPSEKESPKGQGSTWSVRSPFSPTHFTIRR